MTKPTISILVLCYQQSEFVRQALESVFIQTGNFDREIVFADDGSEDDSLAQALSCAVDHGIDLRVVEERNHLGLVGNLRRGIKACRGQYVAFIEADDYWLSPGKLEQQRLFLDTHQDCVMCAHRLLVLGPGENDSRETGDPQVEKLHAKRLAKGNFIGNFSSCMYRMKVLRSLPDSLFTLPMADWVFNIAVAEQGMIGFLRDVLSVYRIHEGGSWSGKSPEEKIAEGKRTIPLYDAYFEGRYTNEFAAMLREGEIRLKRQNSN